MKYEFAPVPLKYPQPYSIRIPDTGNLALEARWRDSAHHSAKYLARRKHKDKMAERY